MWQTWRCIWLTVIVFEVVIVILIAVSDNSAVPVRDKLSISTKRISNLDWIFTFPLKFVITASKNSAVLNFSTGKKKFYAINTVVDKRENKYALWSSANLLCCLGGISGTLVANFTLRTFWLQSVYA